MTRVGNINFKTALLCDDVRQEQGTGKYILIGVYSSDVILPELPASIQLAFYLEVETAPGRYDLELRLSGPQKSEAIMKASLEGAEGGIGVIASPRIGIQMEQEGVFRLDARVPNGRWTNLISKKVIVRSGPTFSLPPPARSRPDVQNLT